MKKLEKLQINPEKLIKNEELILLKGGNGWYWCFDICYSSGIWDNYLGPIYITGGLDGQAIMQACTTLYGQTCGCIAPAGGY